MDRAARKGYQKKKVRKTPQKKEREEIILGKNLGEKKAYHKKKNGVKPPSH